MQPWPDCAIFSLTRLARHGKHETAEQLNAYCQRRFFSSETSSSKGNNRTRNKDKGGGARLAAVVSKLAIRTKGQTDGTRPPALTSCNPRSR